MDDVEAVMRDQPVERFEGPAERERILRLLDDRMRKVVMRELRLQLVAADVCVMRVLAGRAQRLHFGKCGCRRAGPAVSRGEMKDPHGLIWYSPRAMPVDQELLEILACPICKEEVKLVSLDETRRTSVRDKFREKFRGEEPEVEQGLQCVKCRRIYPIVSDIPVMLVEEAFEEG